MSVLRDKRFLLALVAVVFTVLAVVWPQKATQLNTIENKVDNVVQSLPDATTQPAATEPAGPPTGGEP